MSTRSQYLSNVNCFVGFLVEKLQCAMNNARGVFYIVEINFIQTGATFDISE